MGGTCFLECSDHNEADCDRPGSCDLDTALHRHNEEPWQIVKRVRLPCLPLAWGSI
ncbi:mCG1048049 [Mus musculus]|nr:mCG1048049 [Mus musculus]